MIGPLLLVSAFVLVLTLIVARSFAIGMTLGMVVAALIFLTAAPPLLAFTANTTAVFYSLRIGGLFFLISIMLLLKERSQRYSYFRAKPRYRPVVTFYLLVPLLLLLQGQLVGLMRLNSPTFLISDGARLAATAVIIHLMARPTAEPLLRAAIAAAYALLLFDLANLSIYTVSIATGGYQRFGGGTIPGVTLAALLFLRREGSPLLRHRILFCTQLAVIAFSLTRGMWLATTFIILLTVLSQPSTRIAARLTLTLFVLVIFIGLALPGLSSLLTARLDAATRFDTDTSYVGRLNETRDALADLHDLPLGSLIGAGSGATFPLRDQDTVVLVEEHHIHNTFASVYYRHGLVGMVLFIPWIGAICYRAARLLFRRQTIPFDLQWAAIGTLAITLLSLSVYSIIGDPLALILIGTTLRGSGRDMTPIKSEQPRDSHVPGD